MNDYLKDIAAIWKKINELSVSLSSFSEQKHAETEAEMSDTWDSSVIYEVGKYVAEANSLWRCKILNENCRPGLNSIYWEKVNIASELNRLAAIINKEA